MEGFNKQRLFILIAAGVGVIATFLPWAKVSLFGFSESALGLSTGGWISLLFYAGAGTMAFLGDKAVALEKQKMTLVLVLGALGVLFTLFKIIQIGSESMISASFGVFLALLAGLALVGIYFFVNEKGEISSKPKKVDFNEIKDDLKDVAEDIKDMTDKEEKTEVKDTEEKANTDDKKETPPEA